MKKLLILHLVTISVGSLNGLTQADEPTDKVEATATTSEKLVFDTEWKGERIALPPSFAPEMKLKGIEEIRFAPGMFDPNSDSFFTYAFVFSVSKDQELTKEVIHRETLAYYRGLAQSILKSKGKEVDASKFTFKLEQAKEATETPKNVAATKVIQYSGKLDWVEPFATAKPQVLHFEIQSWADPKTAKNYLFVCTSPKEAMETSAIWTELRKIRHGFEVVSDSGK
jgi:hypothetical protein